MTDRSGHKHAVRQAFNRAASSYDGAADVQREICLQLADLASTWHPEGRTERILDAGCGTGYGLELIAERFPGSICFAVDFAPAMLARMALTAPCELARRAICADLESLPFADDSFDAVWSSLALQWCDPALALGEFARVLRPGGIAWLATLGPKTLWELRDAFSAVDEAEHLIGFHDAREWGVTASRAGFTTLMQRNQAAFALAHDLRGLIRHIKGIGAHAVPPRERRPSLGRAGWRALESRYEIRRREDGSLPATYDVILFALRKT